MRGVRRGGRFGWRGSAGGCGGLVGSKDRRWCGAFHAMCLYTLWGAISNKKMRRRRIPCYLSSVFVLVCLSDQSGRRTAVRAKCIHIIRVYFMHKYLFQGFAAILPLFLAEEVDFIDITFFPSIFVLFCVRYLSDRQKVGLDLFILIGSTCENLPL